MVQLAKRILFTYTLSLNPGTTVASARSVLVDPNRGAFLAPLVSIFDPQGQSAKTDHVPLLTLSLRLEAGLLLASWFLRDAHDPVRSSNRDEPRMRMIECLLFAVPSSLLPPGSKTLVTYQRLLTGFCNWARESRSECLRVLALPLLQIPVAVLPCRWMCAELFLDLGWGAPFPDVVHRCAP